MKQQLFAPILALMLLSACAKPAESAGTTANSQISNTHDSSAPAGYDPNVKLAVMGDATPMPGFDAQNKYALGLSREPFQETDTFFIGGTTHDNILHYYDKITGISDYLCANPACDHKDKSCGAYTVTSTAAFWYNGQRWWIASKESGTQDDRDWYLYRSDLSGLNQERIKRIGFLDIVLTYQPQQFAIHRGNLFALGRSSTVNGTETQERLTLIASPLDGTDTFTTLFDETFPDNVYAHNYMSFAGTKVYYTLTTWGEDLPSTHTVTTYDFATKEYEVIYYEVLEEDDYIQASWVTPEGALYLSGYDLDTNYLWKVEGGKRILAASWQDTTEGYPWPYIADGIVVNLASENGIRRMEIHDFTGKLLLKTDRMFPENIPGMEDDPNACTFSFVGGDKDKIIVSLGGDSRDYILMLDIQGEITATVLWSHAK